MKGCHWFYDYEMICYDLMCIQKLEKPAISNSQHQNRKMKAE